MKTESDIIHPSGGNGKHQSATRRMFFALTAIGLKVRDTNPDGDSRHPEHLVVGQSKRACRATVVLLRTQPRRAKSLGQDLLGIACVRIRTSGTSLESRFEPAGKPRRPTLVITERRYPPATVSRYPPATMSLSCGVAAGWSWCHCECLSTHACPSIPVHTVHWPHCALAEPPKVESPRGNRIGC